ncbi:hypothetical protein EC844_1286 [Acinetobacter calcoaceticus]|uniref:Uncharacterized protein n=1 Tax=Acinetobacter calcoaceticus TaxID=471 RepID=A0A4V6NJ68_ACICA|nr:hypothetical protein EC844_1286 [Acinetobacter calcoaceticus]
MNNLSISQLNHLKHISFNVKGLIFPDIDHPYDYSITNESLYQQNLNAIIGLKIDDIVRLPVQATLRCELSSKQQPILAVYIAGLKTGHLATDDALKMAALFKRCHYQLDDAFHVNALIIEDSQNKSRQRAWRVRLDMPFFVDDITIKNYI